MAEIFVRLFERAKHWASPFFVRAVRMGIAGLCYVLCITALIQIFVRVFHFYVLPWQLLIPKHFTSPLYVVMANFVYTVNSINMAFATIALALAMIPVCVPALRRRARIASRQIPFLRRVRLTRSVGNGLISWQPYVWLVFFLGVNLYNAAIDMHPELAACQLAIVAAYGLLHYRWRKYSHWSIRYGAMAVFTVISLVLSAWVMAPITRVEMLTTGFWIVLVLGLVPGWFKTYTVPAQASIWVLLSPLVYIGVGFLVSSSPMTYLYPRGAIYADSKNGMSYAFCELPTNHAVATLFPHCLRNHENCIDGEIAIFDPTTFATLQRIRPFSDSMYGRLHDIACIGSSVYVSFDTTRYSAVPDKHSLTEVSAGLTQKSAFRMQISDGTFAMAEAATGEANFLIMPATDAVLLTSEITDKLIYWTAGSERMPEVGASIRKARRHQRPAITMRDLAGFAPAFNGSLQTSPDAVDPKRRTGFLGSWMVGDAVYEIRLDTFEVVRTFDTGLGAVFTVAVDTQRRRLIAVGAWGFAVYDLDTGELIQTTRTEFLARRIALDYKHGRLIVPSTLGLNARIYSLDDYKLIGKIPLGFGARESLIAPTYDQLWIGNHTSHFVFWLDQMGLQ